MLTDGQRAIRASGIGASEISAIAGINPWKGPHQVWMDKLGMGDEVQDNAHTERGRFIEGAIARWVEHRTGRKVSLYDEAQQTFCHTEHPIVLATPDGLIDPDEVLEIKCPSFHTAHHWGAEGTDEVPDYYLTQVTWQMAATRRTAATVAAYFDDALHLYRVDYSPELFATLLELAERFWKEHVEAKEPPPVDGGKACASWLKERYPKAMRAQLLESTSDAAYWAAELRAAKQAGKAAEAQELLARNHLEAIIGEAEGIEGEWGKIYWRNNKPKVVTDWAALGKVMCPPPDMLARHSRIDWESLCSELHPNDELLAQYRAEVAGPRPFRCYFKEEK